MSLVFRRCRSPTRAASRPCPACAASRSCELVRRHLQGPKNFFAELRDRACGRISDVPGDRRFRPTSARRFSRDRRGALIGRGLADKFGWKVGDTFSSRARFRPIASASRSSSSSARIYDVDRAKHPGYRHQCRCSSTTRISYEATNRRVEAGTLRRRDRRSRAGGARSARPSMQLFENSDAQTKTETEAAFMAGFIVHGRQPLAACSTRIGLAVAFTILLVTANTMSMAVRERRTEIAVLKTLGFSGGLVLTLSSPRRSCSASSAACSGFSSHGRREGPRARADDRTVAGVCRATSGCRRDWRRSASLCARLGLRRRLRAGAVSAYRRPDHRDAAAGASRHGDPYSYNLRNVRAALARDAAAIVGIALVVAVFIVLLAHLERASALALARHRPPDNAHRRPARVAVARLTSGIAQANSEPDRSTTASRATPTGSRWRRPRLVVAIVCRGRRTAADATCSCAA